MPLYNGELIRDFIIDRVAAGYTIGELQKEYNDKYGLFLETDGINELVAKYKEQIGEREVQLRKEFEEDRQLTKKILDSNLSDLLYTCNTCRISCPHKKQDGVGCVLRKDIYLKVFKDFENLDTDEIIKHQLQVISLAELELRLMLSAGSMDGRTVNLFKFVVDCYGRVYEELKGKLVTVKHGDADADEIDKTVKEIQEKLSEYDRIAAGANEKRRADKGGDSGSG
jgi:uncharacterized protein YdbL (DUF1318 family)